MECNIPRVVIAATKSGSGKTTIVTGLLAALKQKGLKVQPYKVGPDYIDPGYHRLASGQPSHNLDSWLMPKETMKEVFALSAARSELAVIEGVMGLYDGGSKGISSTAEIARLLEAPVVLVIDCKSMGASAAALALGFKMYDKDVKLAGVILNRLGSDNHERIIREALEQLDIPVLGAVRRNDELIMPERHLGLLPVEENQEQEIIDRMGEAMASQIDVEAVINIGRQAPPMQVPEHQADDGDLSRVRIGIARDEAFSFYYPESIRILEEKGAEIVEFSPLNDSSLPQVDGLIFGGGFPEMFAEQLSNNKELIADIREAAAKGMPVYAECGGFMFLSKAMEDFDGKVFPMCDILPCRVKMNKKLQMVGYVSAQLQGDSILGKQGTVIKGHEFHFSTEDEDGGKTDAQRAFLFTRSRNGAQYLGGYSKGNVLGSYLHLHFAGCPEAVASFVARCREYNLKISKE
ncbi:Cobyrinic acid A,C-diamide synthase [Anaerovibrio sp. JC8]|uniref:cobyrinate a,c-diamide synthase n=1 Tax=Anaerovibrio sp. JC8 TaxID=1240085 RepID=UPI000A0A0E80|nr:cobyrinate a,c-diamide synthase [Anaerovibrio sp. JC8]ORT99540.1 Cobyrinic acid A,C-diamide synthase [Anaerovibrio sp. JC8]